MCVCVSVCFSFSASLGQNPISYIATEMVTQIYIKTIYVFVFVCVCVCVRERENRLTEI